MRGLYFSNKCIYCTFDCCGQMEPPEIDPETDEKWDYKTHLSKTFFVFWSRFVRFWL
jgi:hypothetical protein